MNDAMIHGNFSDILAVADKAARPICIRLRAVILSAHKNALEVVWPKLGIASFGVGPRKMTEHYAYIGVHRSHINLGFYHGAMLPDPSGLLEGTGKKLRHVKIRSRESVELRAIKELLKAAVSDRLRKGLK